MSDVLRIFHSNFTQSLTTLQICLKYRATKENNFNVFALIEVLWVFLSSFISRTINLRQPKISRSNLNIKTNKQNGAILFDFCYFYFLYFSNEPFIFQIPCLIFASFVLLLIVKMMKLPILHCFRLFFVHFLFLYHSRSHSRGEFSKLVTITETGL